MNTELLHPERGSLQARAAVMDAAERRAIALRREAMNAMAASLARRLRALWPARPPTREPAA